MNYQRILAVAKREWQEIYRDRLFLSLAFVFPITMMIAFAYGLSLDVEAHVFTDAFPDQPFIAEVDYIASRSQFTPKEVQTKEERVKQVFALKLYLNENPEHSLSPGMPADALIRWKDDVSWRLPVQ